MSQCYVIVESFVWTIEREGLSRLFLIHQVSLVN